MEKRKNKCLDNEAIVMTSEFRQLWQSHLPIVEDFREYGLSQLKTVNYDNCPICFIPIKKKKNRVLFRCGRHPAHKKCALNYYSSGYRSNYLCPMRCAEAEG